MQGSQRASHLTPEHSIISATSQRTLTGALHTLGGGGLHTRGGGQRLCHGADGMPLNLQLLELGRASAITESIYSVPRGQVRRQKPREGE